MRKILLIVAAVVAVFLVGCTETVDYKAKSEQLAKHVEELCQQQADTAAVIAVMDSIQALEENVVATGDSALIADYNAVKKTAYNHYAVYVASLTTFTISSFQPIKLYVYLAVSSFVGVSPSYAGVSP